MICPNCNKEVIMQPKCNINGLNQVRCPKCGIIYSQIPLKDNTDWNSTRTQAAIAAMQGMVSNHDLMCSLRSGDEKEKEFSPYICINVTTKLAEKATKYVDALITELKKGE